MSRPTHRRALRRPSNTSVTLFCAAAILGCTVSALKGADTPNAPQKASDAERFDLLVRNDFFQGIAGDEKALERGLKTCEQMLSKNPKHAEALVWHGAGLMSLAGRHFTAGDQQQGIAKWTRSLQEMDEAVKLEPKNVGVLVPRAATLITASRYVPDEKQKQALLERVVADYGTVYDLQKADLSKLGVHPRGELLFGLAEGWRRLGDETKAKLYLDQILATCKDSPYEKEALEWLKRDAATPAPTTHNCVGCHVPN